MARRAAFTLIELLVVIAIIALLLAILLPSLAKAREAGRFVVCLSNQAQIGKALVMYADTFKELTPRESGNSEGPAPLYPGLLAPGYQNAGQNITWAFNLRPFLDPLADTRTADGGLTDMFAKAKYYRCPSRPVDGHNIHYVVNGLRFIRPGVTTTEARRPTRTSKYPRPSSTIYLADFIDDPTRFRSNAWYTTDTFQVSVYYDLTTTSNVNGTDNGAALTAQRVAPKRHSRGAATLFLDGHAAHITAADLTSVGKWDDGDYTPESSRSR